MPLIPSSPSAPVEPGERARILIVDDSADKRLVIKSILEELDQTLVFAHSGAEALRAVLQHEFAVILLDVNMPGMDGFETADLIRQYRRSAATPIIFVTAYVDDVQTARGYELGAVDYIMSPILPPVLRAKVKVFVELHLSRLRLQRHADEHAALLAAQAARAASELNMRRTELLAHLADILVRSQSVQTAAVKLARAIVPRLARGVIVALRGTEGQARLFMARGDHAFEASDGNHIDVDEPEFESLPGDAQSVLESALQEDSGKPNEVPPSAWECVPLLAGERSIGVLLFDGLSEEGSAIALELASRVALAMGHVRLFEDLRGEVTIRRQAEEDLRGANQRKDVFLAMLSHELRNPLNALRLSIDLMRRIAASDIALMKSLDIAQRQVNHLTHLVSDLLDTARVSHGKISLTRAPLDLVQVLRDAVEACDPLVRQHAHTLTLAVPDEPVCVHGDAARLTQVFGNLLSNAAKYTPDGGKVTLSAEVSDSHAVIRVTDNGVGIDETLLPKIFDAFSQGNRTLDRSQGGLGVGLTLVQQLVQLHGGMVKASSDGPMKGACFEVRLPLSAAAGPAWAGSVPALSLEGAGRALNILVVDDQVDAADALGEALRVEGHHVSVCNDGESALRMIASEDFHVVLLDIGLPLMDGYEVARRMRISERGQQLTIAAVSGYGSEIDKRASKAAGMDAHFVKPVELPTLIAYLAIQRLPLKAQASVGLMA